jgi:hypothetical protein
MEGKVIDYEFEAEHGIYPKELHKKCDGEPAKVKEHSDKLLEIVENDKKKLLDEIEDEEKDGKIYPSEAEDLKDRVLTAAKTAKENIKETNNVVVEGIDDSSDTEHLLYEFLPFIIVSEVPLLRILYVVYTLCNLNVFSTLYYQILSSSKPHSFTSLLLLCAGILSIIFLGISNLFTLSNEFICDAPRA